jgi:hypothetical protein
MIPALPTPDFFRWHRERPAGSDAAFLCFAQTTLVSFVNPSLEDLGQGQVAFYAYPSRAYINQTPAPVGYISAPLVSVSAAAAGVLNNPKGYGVR